MMIVSQEVGSLGISSVIAEYVSPDSRLPKRELICRAGEIFWQSCGRCYFAELFLKGIITASWDKPNGQLAPAMSALTNNRARAYQAAKIKEDCVAMLMPLHARLQLETKLALSELEAEPPYDCFMANAAALAKEWFKDK